MMEPLQNYTRLVVIVRHHEDIHSFSVYSATLRWYNRTGLSPPLAMRICTKSDRDDNRLGGSELVIESVIR